MVDSRLFRLGVRWICLNRTQDRRNIHTPMFEWYVVKCGSKNRHCIHVLKNRQGLHVHEYASHFRVSLVNMDVGFYWGGPT